MKDLREKLYSLTQNTPTPYRQKEEPVKEVKAQILSGLKAQKDLYSIVKVAVEYLASESKDPEFRYEALKSLSENYGIYNEYTQKREENPSLFGEPFK